MRGHRFVAITSRLGCVLLVALLAACGGGGGPAADDAAPSPSPSISPSPSPSPVVLTLARLAGDGQTAAPGTAVAVAPEVVVRDGGGAPVAGVAVRFEVTQGGGGVVSTLATTDAEGRASSGGWTLGAAKGPNVLSASVEGLAAVTFTATAAVVSADLQVSMVTPQGAQVVGEAVTVAANVASIYQIASVTASVEGQSVALALGPFGRNGIPAWNGVLALGSRPRGPAVLVVTASDVFGHATDAVVSVTLDRAPSVAIGAPLDGTVARPGLALALDCSDDDTATGCVALSVGVDRTVLASGTSAINATVDLSAHEGQSVTLDISATDSIGQVTRLSRQVYVESSPRLVQRVETAGKVWDAQGTRVLYLGTDGSTPALKLFDSASATTQTLDVNAALADSSSASGFLGPAGAAWVRRADTSALFEWRAGVASQIAEIDSPSDFRFDGRWALYGQNDNGVVTLVRRDLTDGSTVAVTRQASNTENDVAPNGDVAYWSPSYRVFRWRDGVTLPASGSDPALWYVYPLTDGIEIVYLVATPCCVNTTYRLARFDVDSGVETPLTPFSGFRPEPGSGYAVAGGHIAYQAVDAANTPQVWRRSPSGTEQLSFFGSTSRIDAIGTDGTVLFSNGSKRYQATPGAALRQVGSSLGLVVVRDGRFVVLLGRSVFDLLP